jgi:uncharacterized protein (DUF2147 family)
MNRMFLPATVVAMVISSFLANPLYAEPSVVGLWEQSDKKGRVQAWFKFFENNRVYVGAIARVFPAPGEKPATICSKCQGDQKNAPIIDLIIVNGMERNGLSYENGTILDPRDGSVYKASMELSPDGQKLTVRGYLGVPLLGQSQVWRRLPDNAMQQAADSPNKSKQPSGAATRP